MPDVEAQAQDERPLTVVERDLTRFDFRDLTPEGTTCGRCDTSPAGRGAAVILFRSGVIVACAKCQEALRKEAEKKVRRERAHSRRPREKTPAF